MRKEIVDREVQAMRAAGLDAHEEAEAARVAADARPSQQYGKCQGEQSHRNDP